MTGPSDDLIGRVIAGRFRIAGALGTGAMATIYRARDLLEMRDVAVKIVKPDIVRNKTAAARFHREAKAASKLKHPGIVRVVAWGFDVDLPYIAMELVEGEDLFELLDRRGTLTEVEALKVVMTLCDALQAAHEQGIVHRDLKPENIMVTMVEEGEPALKVLDFGIAKLVGPQPGDMWGDETVPQALTKVGSAVGTPSHMAPEQARGEAVDGRTDIYACGVLLYEMVTGHLPFEGDNPLHVAIRQVRDPPPPPSTHNPDLHPELEAIILQALEKDPAARFQSATELEHALRAVLLELDPDLRTVPRDIPPEVEDEGLTRERSMPPGTILDEDSDGEPLTAQIQVPVSLRGMVDKRSAASSRAPGPVDLRPQEEDDDEPLTDVVRDNYEEPLTLDADTIAGPTMRQKVERRIRDAIDKAIAQGPSSADVTAPRAAADERSPASDRTPLLGRIGAPRPQPRRRAEGDVGPAGTFKVTPPPSPPPYDIEDEDSQGSIATVVSDPNDASSSAAQAVREARAIAAASVERKRDPALSVTKESDFGAFLDAAARGPEVQVEAAVSSRSVPPADPNLSPTMPPPPFSTDMFGPPPSLDERGPVASTQAPPPSYAVSQDAPSALPRAGWHAGAVTRGAAHELEDLLRQMPRQRQPIVGSVIVLILLAVAIAALLYLLVGVATF